MAVECRQTARCCCNSGKLPLLKPNLSFVRGQDLGGGCLRIGAPMKIMGWILRCLLAMDFALFVLTFIPAFSGIGQRPGLADRILGNYRFGGWRIDVAWICASSVFIIAFGLRGSTENRSAKITKIACVLWIACFPIYLGYIVIHMFG